MTDTEVANMAIVDHLGLPRINDIDDTTNNRAKTAKAVFETSRQLYLRQAAPGFARKEVGLAIVTDEESDKYEFVYGYPSDCMKVREILNPSGSDKRIEFELGGHSVTATSRTILTNQEEARLIYTRDITNLNMFDDDDILALSLLIAWKIAMPLTRKRTLADDMRNNYLAALVVAQRNDKSDQHVELPKFEEYIDARR